jgi:hypothetical protein
MAAMLQAVTIVLFNQPRVNVLTKNTDKLRQEVAAHIEADAVVQGDYWDPDAGRGCFIGCLAHSNSTVKIELTYGLPSSILKIAESIFEALPQDEAQNFFAALPDAVACDGKDLSRVCWQFLAAELKALPPTEAQSVVDPVIAGMELLAAGERWSDARAATAAAARAATAATYAAYAAYAAAAYATAAYATYAADAAAYATYAADAAARAADARAAATYAATAADAATYAATAADAARAAATYAATAADAARAAAAAARARQRDLLLRLISEAPVIQ